MRIVADTNVLVSGLLSPFGPPATVVSLVARGDLQLCYDARLLAEYREVLARPVFGFDQQHARVLLAQVEAEGCATVCAPLHLGLPDADDEPVLEVALTAAAEYLVTGNTRHFPAGKRRGMAVVTPRQFLTNWRADPRGGDAATVQ